VSTNNHIALDAAGLRCMSRRRQVAMSRQLESPALAHLASPGAGETRDAGSFRRFPSLVEPLSCSEREQACLATEQEISVSRHGGRSIAHVSIGALWQVRCTDAE
jgi:hypothetical protein